MIRKVLAVGVDFFFFLAYSGQKNLFRLQK